METRPGEIKNIKDVKVNSEVYKIVSNTLNKKQWENHKKELRKIDVSADLYETENSVCLEIYNDKIRAKATMDNENFDVSPLDLGRIIAQISKTGNTIFNVKNVNVNARNLKLPISKLNNLRREAIEKFEETLEDSIRREADKDVWYQAPKSEEKNFAKPKVNLFLQKYDPQIDYSKFAYNEIYVQFKDLINAPRLRNCIVVLPNIIDQNYEKLIRENLHVFDKAEAVMISHLSQTQLLQDLGIHKKLLADYTLNITNNLAEKVVKDLGIERITMSPELDKNEINNFAGDIEKELVIYGRTCLMTSKYCPIGKNGKCGRACEKGIYELKDRKNFVFPVVADSTNCHSKIYNSKISKIDLKGVNAEFVRIDILNETENEIQKIFDTIK